MSRARTALLVLLTVYVGSDLVRHQGTRPARWTGPLRPLLVTVQWVRSDAAFAAGDPTRGFALAERALALAPDDPNLWEALVWRQAVELASPDRTPQAERRGAWLASGVALAERAESVVADPGRLARLAGDVLLLPLLGDGPLPEWPGGREGLARSAEAHYRRALAAGEERAAAGLEALERVRTR